MSKLHYHLEIWGSCSRSQKSFINNQLTSIAIHVSNLKTGLTDQHYMVDMKWSNFNDLYKQSIIKISHKILNSKVKDRNSLYYDLIEDRNIRSHAENKTGPIKPIKHNDNITHKTFIYNVKAVYASLPRSLTLIPDSVLFKKWLKIHFF